MRSDRSCGSGCQPAGHCICPRHSTCRIRDSCPLSATANADATRPTSRGSGCRGTSPSSWTATAAGRGSGACRGSKGIATAPPASAASPRSAPGWASSSSRSTAFPARTGNARPRNSISSCNCSSSTWSKSGRGSWSTTSACGGSAAARGCRDEAVRELDETVRLSAGNTGLCVCLAINYGGRAEMVDAVRRIAAEVRRGTLDPAAIDEDDARRPALHGRHARARSADSHGRRDADQQLPALADQLRGDLGDGRLLARFRRGPTPRRACAATPPATGGSGD